MRHGVASFLLPLLVLVVSAAAGAYYVLDVAPEGMFPGHDIYAYSLPRMLYAVESFRAGGKGLLWNPFQNCGQPFFALSQTGLLYPPNWLFLVLAPAHALRAVIVVNHVIAGAGIYLLARTLGTSPLAAICGMLVLQLGTTMPVFSTSALPHLGAYAWLPVALLASERLLDRPGASRAVQLAIVLAIQWLPGSPQAWFLTAQLIGLRLLWALAWSASGRRLRTVGWMAVALGLAPALAAVQVVPEVAAANVSLRSSGQRAQEANPTGLLTRKELDLDLYSRGYNHRAVVPALVPLAFAALALGGRRHRGIFYAVAGVLYGVLAFGPATRLFDLYLLLPGASMFRIASRFLWISGFCFAVLTALGVEAVSGRRAAGAGYLPRLVVVALVAIGFVVADRAVPEGLFPRERWVAILAAAGALAMLWRARLWPLTQLAIVAVVGIILVSYPGVGSRALLPGSPGYEARRDVLDALAPRLSPQERVYPVGRSGFVVDFSLIPKLASLYRIRSATDYEPLLSARYAEFAVRMRAGHFPGNRNESIYMAELGAKSSRRLLDLTATRYLVVDRSEVDTLAGVGPLPTVLTAGETYVLENPTALPRAFFVPRIAVVADSRALLERLATGTDDLRQVALVEVAPSAFTGLPGDGAGAAVRFVIDDPEHIELAVDAPTRGFLVLSDQYDTGWKARVNGTPAPIVRGNYAFRVVDVPAGRSTVEFRYRPTSLLVGAGISVLAIALAALLMRRAAATQPRAT
jgi:hypothetical protein